MLGAYGKDENFYTIKGVVELILNAFGIDVRYVRSGLSYLHPGRSADLMKGNKSIGYVGEVHPAVCRSMNVSERIYIAELNIDLINKYEDVLKELSKDDGLIGTIFTKASNKINSPVR